MTAQARYEAEVSRVWATQAPDGAHDLGHLRRVWKTARLIAMDVPADAEILLAACFFHDLVNLPKDAPNRADASRLSAEAPLRDERQALLDRVTRHGFIDDYAGIRISAKGRRFAIRQAIVWNLIAVDGTRHGQAAAFVMPAPQ